MTTPGEKGSAENPVCPLDLPWTAPADGFYQFHFRGWDDTHEPRPLRGEYMRAGETVTALSPSGTPISRWSN